MRACLIALLCSTLLPAGVDARSQPDRPVLVGDSGGANTCSRIGTVVGLDPHGDNFLSVMSGPGGRPFVEKDRIHTDQELAICGERAPWFAVVYDIGKGDGRCGISGLTVSQRIYAGPCRFGWVHSRYVEIAHDPEGDRHPDFPAGEGYARSRDRLLKLGWRPLPRKVRNDDCPASDIRCRAFPEANSCSSTGKGSCRFDWLGPNNELMGVYTEGEAPPVITETTCLERC